ncbi:MAG: hypothetical protein LBR32_08245 [Propionibacteriaceae bacterium]|jgi:hypothetical protein|nr:hypothetical protein [Propionibacteriaceae bacterium]
MSGVELARPGAWVEVESTILTPEQRAAGLPSDTAATPLTQWVNGFLQGTAPAKVGDEVTVKSIIGREHTGRISRINPSYHHSFGETVDEILTIGTEYES